ncbi:MAG: L-threonylcarbamoyladenylate synthase [Treponema sp.]|jgi:tRNA threonylcarbamoyl adenosine modification protein (Sua5/YciO/YrdC/YwlC family)|nr:L-threonylcarbamoyladenylate synthase [Treponema sp.]
MIEYIVPSNIDERKLTRACTLLADGNLLALPTDTSWSIVCSLKSIAGIRKLKTRSGERDERHFTLLCSDISQFGEWCSMDNSQFRLIRRLVPGPYVFVLKTLIGTDKVLGLHRKEIGIRISNHPVPQAIIKALGSPLYSITAKHTMLPDYQAPDVGSENADDFPVIPEEALFEGGWELESLEGVSMVLDTGLDQERLFSTVLDLSGDTVQLLRAGAGEWPV